MATAPLSLTGRALRLLSQREHARVELERKLAAHAESPEALAKVLDTLQAKGYLNESRVVDSVLHRRAEKFGAARIRHELLTRGLGADQVAQAVDRLQSTELERARGVWQRKFGESVASTPQERARQMRFLASRGFSGDVIRRVVAGADND